MALADLVEAHARRRQSVTERLIRFLLGLWRDFDDWNDDDLVRARAARAGIYVESALGEMRRIARVYNLRVARELNAPVIDLPMMQDIYPRSLIDVLEVYQRPVQQYRWELRSGKTRTDARAAFEQRMRAIAELDVAAVNRDEANVVRAAAPQIIGYRRVIHPELSRTGTCGLCVVAADRFYKSDDLAAIHDECKCETVGFTEKADPALRLNRADLDEIYAAAGGNSSEELKRVRVAFREHGELGPILVHWDQHFRARAAVGRGPYAVPDLAENVTKLGTRRDVLEETLASLLARARAGDDGQNVLDAISDTEDALEALNRRLAA
jgi:hypothetical protein